MRSIPEPDNKERLIEAGKKPVAIRTHWLRILVENSSSSSKIDVFHFRRDRDSAVLYDGPHSGKSHVNQVTLNKGRPEVHRVFNPNLAAVLANQGVEVVLLDEPNKDVEDDYDNPADERIPRNAGKIAVFNHRERIWEDAYLLKPVSSINGGASSEQRLESPAS